MKLKKHVLTALLLTGLAAGTVSTRAADTNAPGQSAPNAKQAKPYPLKTCIVSGEAFGGDMGKPITLTYQGQEMKFCCKGCVKDFNQDPQKWLKKFEEEKAKAAATEKK